jgi:hypothetical protein
VQRKRHATPAAASDVPHANPYSICNQIDIAAARQLQPSASQKRLFIRLELTVRRTLQECLENALPGGTENVCWNLRFKASIENSFQTSLKPGDDQ